MPARSFGPFASDGIPIKSGAKVQVRVKQTSGEAQMMAKFRFGIATLEPKGSGGLLLPATGPDTGLWVPPENPIFYVGNQDNKVQQRQGASILDWEFTDPVANVISLATNPDNVLVAGDQNNDLWRIDPDGNEVWKVTEHTTWVEGLEISADGFIYSCSGSLVRKMDLDGNVVWAVDTGRSGPKHALSLSGTDTLYAVGTIGSGTNDAGLVKLDTSDGSVVWRVTQVDGSEPTGVGLAADPDGYVNAGLAQNRGARFDPDGNLVWEFTTPTNDVPGVACSPDAVFFSSFDQKVYKVDFDGNEVWQHDLGGVSYRVEVVPDGSIYATRGDAVRQLDPDGTEVFTTSSTGATVRSLAALPGRYGAFG